MAEDRESDVPSAKGKGEGKNGSKGNTCTNLCMIVHTEIYRLPLLPPTSKLRRFDVLMDFYWKWGVWIGNGVLVHPQFCLLCGAALPGAFLKKSMTFMKNLIFANLKYFLSKWIYFSTVLDDAIGDDSEIRYVEFSSLLSFLTTVPQSLRLTTPKRAY